MDGEEAQIEVQPESQPEAEPVSYDWKGYGLEDLSERKPEEIAQEIKTLRYNKDLYGRQANELGSLRKQYEEAQQRIAEFEKLAGREPAPQAAQPSVFDEMQREQMMREFEKGNPIDYFHKHLSERFNESYATKDSVQEMIQKALEEGFGKYAQWNEQQQASQDPEYEMYQSYIKTLQDDQYFGNTRPTKELLEFAKFRANEKDEELVNMAYNLMREYPNMRLDTAKKWAAMDLAQQRLDTTQPTRDKAAKVRTVAKTNGAAKGSQDEKITTMDEAFE